MAIARNHTGHRVGESHPKAKLSDAQCREMRRLRESDPKVYTNHTLSVMFHCGESTARDITNYYTRAGA